MIRQLRIAIVVEQAPLHNYLLMLRFKHIASISKTHNRMLRTHPFLSDHWVQVCAGHLHPQRHWPPDFEDNSISQDVCVQGSL